MRGRLWFIAKWVMAMLVAAGFPASRPGYLGIPAAHAAAGQVTNIEIPIGGTRVLRVGTPITSVNVVSRSIADVVANPPDELIVTGKAVGRTEITATDKAGAHHTYAVRVTSTGDTLKDKLNALFPNQLLDVQIVGQSIILSGYVNDVSLVEKVEKVVAAYTGSQGDKEGGLRIANLIQVRGTPQVQLEVRFAEVSRTALRKMGFNIWFKNTGNQPATAGLLSSGTTLAPSLTPLSGGANSGNGQASPLELPNQMPTLTGAQALQPSFNLVFTTAQAAQLPISATLSLLASRGFAKTLAEPTLVALSGQDASFLAGGEFPIPSSSGLGIQTATFKKYGIQLLFTPFVLGDDAIQLRLQTVVSEIDFAVAVNISGGSVPGLKTRDSSTTIRLRNGQSFAIAGLLSDTMSSLVDKVPGLGDLPVIGALFRSTRFQRSETELLVVVTAHLVTPVGEGERIRVPGEDELSDPSDLELFLLGSSESHSAAPAGRVGYMR